MKMAVACDHGGLELKRAVVVALEGWGHEVKDLGVESADSVDYPDYAAAVARHVAEGAVELGVLVCGTGIGMSIAANKVPGVRAALAGDAYSARMAREHNDANVLCMGNRVTGTEKGVYILKTFLDAEFAGGRHQRRIDKIVALEQGKQ